MERIHEIGRELRDLEEQFSRMEWTQYTTGFDFGVDEAYKKIVDFMKDKSNYETITSP